NVDILPTLLELCGAGAPPGDAFHGRSLAALLRGQTEGWPERAIVTDSQRLLRPLKWRLSCVMRDSWRLINGRALYDLAGDPEQRHDVSAAHPEVVARLRADYESWWELVSPASDAPSPIAIGDGAAGAVCLTAHDWRREPDRQREPAIGPEEYGDDARCVWNQAQVRQGPEQHGYWELEVQRAGWYRFELRRWPREAARPLQAGIPGPLPRYDRMIAAGYGGGRAIPIERAALRIAGVEASRAVGPADTAAVFELELAAGAARLETAFTNAAGLDLGAYYVYVEYLR
ncbi:MAG TPA: hypothetical protein VHN78_14130, partial [Chloroflexota bacterium]|nr:hypothetical protein [Chloroflexota bacterium]